MRDPPASTEDAQHKALSHAGRRRGTLLRGIALRRYLHYRLAGGVAFEFRAGRTSGSIATLLDNAGNPSGSGYQVIVYSNAFPNLSTYPDNRQILVDWGNNGTPDQTHTGLAQWAMPDYDEVRTDYDDSDASGAPQFYHLIDIPPGHTAGIASMEDVAPATDS